MKYNIEAKTKFNFKDFKILNVNYIHIKEYKEVVESRIISNYDTIKQRLDFFTLSHLVRLVSRCLIRELIIYEFKLGHQAAKTF